MATVNWSGTISNAQTMFAADDNHVTGNLTVDTGGVLTIEAGVTLKFDGNYNFLIKNSGKIIANGTSSSKITLKSNATNAKSGDWSWFDFKATSTGSSIKHWIVKDASAGTTNSYAFILELGGTITLENIKFINCGMVDSNNRGVFHIWSTNSVVRTIKNLKFEKCHGISIAINDTQANVFDNVEIVNSGNLNNVAPIYINSASKTIFRRLFVNSNNTMDEGWGAIRVQGTNCDFEVDKSVFISTQEAITPWIAGSSLIRRSIFLNVGIRGIDIFTTHHTISSGNDFINCREYGILARGVSISDGDYFEGCNKYEEGVIDTSTTANGLQYSGLQARYSGASAQNYPFTPNSVTAGSIDQRSVLLTWNTSGPTTSMVKFGLSTGQYTMGYFETDNDWTGLEGGTSYKDFSGTHSIIGSPHSIVISGLNENTKYFYQVGGKNPAGSEFWSTESSFTTLSLGQPTVNSIALDAYSITTNDSITATAYVVGSPSFVGCEIAGSLYELSLVAGSQYNKKIKGIEIGPLTNGSIWGTATNVAGGHQTTASSLLTVTSPTIQSSQVLHDFTVYLRDRLLTNITDPISATRSSNSKFVMTSFPQRNVEYPLVVVEVSGWNTKTLGISTESDKIKIQWKITIFSKSTKQRDEIFDEIYNFLRTFQLDSAGSIREANLYDFSIDNFNNVDEEGKHGIHQKIIIGSYSYFTTT